MADVVGPRSTAVRLASERVALRRRIRRPRSAQAGRREGAEVTSVAANRLDEHEILVLALDGVYLNSLEQIVRGIAHHYRRLVTEASGEVSNRHARAVDLSVVPAEEEVHVVGIADERLINGSRVRARDLSGGKRLHARPAVRVGGVLGCAVGEGGWAPLVGEDPGVLWLEVEKGGCDYGTGHAVLGHGAHVGPIAEGGKVHRAPVGAVVCGVDEDLAIVVYGGDYDVLVGGFKARNVHFIYFADVL